MNTAMEQTAKQIYELFKKEDNFLIPLHLGSDGDMICSALAMHHVLQNLGKKVRVISEDELDLESKIDFIEPVKEIVTQEPLDLTNYREPIVLVMLDGEGPGRFTNNAVKLDDSCIKASVVIDHHKFNPLTQPTLSYVDPSKSSTTQVIFELLRDWELEITPKIAQLILTGIYTDTGGLNNENISSEAFQDIAELTKLGGDWHEIVVNIAWNIPIETLDYLKEILPLVKYSPEYKCLWVCVPKVIEDKYKGSSANKLFVKEQIFRVMKETEFCCIIQEKENREASFSLRRRAGDLHMGELAAMISKQRGGGHPAAAGARLEEVGLADAEEIFLTSIERYIGSR
jgi:nanoRNase/pAp phosphatase (c-di-AMP/oligoRNAs hydrolase)